MSTAWYDKLREEYRPASVRILLIGESPPDPLDGERRFFYSPRLKIDNLYRGVSIAVLGDKVEVDKKATALMALKARGIWLIDAVDYPVNKLPTSRRIAALRNAAPQVVERCREIAPELGVIICHGKVFAAIAPSLVEAGVRLLHSDPLPFPLGNFRVRFVTGVRDCLARAAI